MQIIDRLQLLRDLLTPICRAQSLNYCLGLLLVVANADISKRFDIDIITVTNVTKERKPGLERQSTADIGPALQQLL